MPNYEYKCTQDSSTFEIWQEVGSAAPPCPSCGAPTKKVFHPTRTIFKGSGFYVTDLRAEKSASAGSSKAPTATPAEPKAPEAAPATPPAVATPPAPTTASAASAPAAPVAAPSK